MKMQKQTIGYVLKCVQSSLRQRLDRTLSDIGLTAPQYSVLRTLKLEPGSSNADLANASFVTPQTMVKILQKLERGGYIQRQPHPSHGRKLTTDLTPAGVRQLEEAQKRVEIIENGLVRDLSKRDQQELKRLLLLCLSNLMEDEEGG
jgi:DNA-binding MarR family transcriptional regulator